MKVSQFLAIACAFLGSVMFLSGLDDPNEVKEKQQQWREALGADDFATREATMKELWAEGEKIVPFLTKLAAGSDPEVSARAAVVLRKVNLGITPDTPEKVAGLIDRYLGGTSQDRIVVLRALVEAKEYDFILRLRRGESEPMVARALDKIIDEVMPEMIRGLLNEGNLERVEQVLSLSDTFEHMIRLADFYKRSGKLDDEIEKLRKAGGEIDQARYLAYLRVKGDPQLLRSEAARLGDRQAEILGALVAGDFVPYFSDLQRKQRVGAATKNYLSWVLADVAGDGNAKKAALNALIAAAKEGGKGELSRVSLFRMGQGEKVIDNLPEKDFANILRYHELQESYLKVEELLGLPDSEGLDDWLAKMVALSKAEVASKTPTVAFTRLVSATSFLEGRGRMGDAEKCCLTVFDLARDNKAQRRKVWLRDLFFAAPISVLSGLAREIDEFEEVASLVIKELPRAVDSHTWLYQLVTKEGAKMTTRERLLMTFSYSHRYPLVPADEYDAFFKRIFQRVVKGEDKAENLEKLFGVLQYRNRAEELRIVLEERAKEGDSEEYLLAVLALDSGQLKKSAKLFEAIEVDLDNFNPVFLYQTGLVMAKAGDDAGRERIEKSELHGDGSVAMKAAFAQQRLHMGDLEESHQFFKEALLRTQTLPVPGNYTGTESLIEGLAAGAAGLGRWEEARTYREVVCLLASYGGTEYGIYYTRHRFEVLVAQGAAAMKQGDVQKAVASFGEAHRILPRDGYLANELFPVMREVGLSEYHDQLFAESARHARESIRRYPKDDNVYNNFAWLASRANRRLDEAEGYLKKALKMNPQSAAYLDTMGEIHFARRNREEAIKWSTKSINNEIFGSASSRWELHQQHRRFKSGDFPAR